MKTTLEQIVRQADCIIKNNVNLDDLNLTPTKLNELIGELAPRLSEMRKLITSNKITLDEEIYCFKQAKPMLLGRIIFLQKVLDMTTIEPLGLSDIKKSFYAEKQEDINRFTTSNIELYQYYRSGSDNFDEYYFTRKHRVFRNNWRQLCNDRDHNFSTYCDIEIAKFVCNDLLSEYISRKIYSLDRAKDVSFHEHTASQCSLKWTDAKNSLVELGYALHAKGSLNNGNVGIKEIMTNLEVMFSIDLGDYYRTYLSLKGRKKDRTSYLSVLKEVLENKMSDDEE